MHDEEEFNSCDAKRRIYAVRNKVLEKYLNQSRSSFSAERVRQEVSERIFENINNDLRLDRISIECQYPIENFLPKAGFFYKKNYVEKALFRVFPKMITVRELWHQFSDGSLIIVAIPDVNATVAGQFLINVKDLADAKKMLGISKELGGSCDLMVLAERGKHVLALSKSDAGKYLEQRCFALNNLLYQGQFRVNLSKEWLGIESVRDLLRSFLEHKDHSFSNDLKEYYLQFQKEGFK